MLLVPFDLFVPFAFFVPFFVPFVFFVRVLRSVASRCVSTLSFDRTFDRTLDPTSERRFDHSRFTARSDPNVTGKLLELCTLQRRSMKGLAPPMRNEAKNVEERIEELTADEEEVKQQLKEIKDKKKAEKKRIDETIAKEKAEILEWKERLETRQVCKLALHFLLTLRSVLALL